MNEENKRQKNQEEKSRKLKEREEEKIRKQDEKAKKKAEKELIARKQKAEKELTSKMRLYTNPEYSMKLMKIIIDQKIREFDFFDTFSKEAEKNDLNYTIDFQLIAQSITWTRNTEDFYINDNQEVCSIQTQVDENQIVVIWNPEDIVTHVSNDTFFDAVSHISSLIPKKRITLVLYGMENYFKQLKNQKDKNQVFKKQKKNYQNYLDLPKLSKKKLNELLVKIQIRFKINSRYIENEVEIFLLIMQYTKSIALLPSKLEKKQESSKFEWYIGYDNKDTVKVDKDGNGLKKLWQQQLCQFPLLSLEIAEAISAVYKSPLQLIQTYEKCNKSEGENLLKDIPIRRAAGPLTSVRKIGPELSKKVYVMFSSECGDTLLS